jgi:outer membrane biosynthesis protein TonB
MRRTPWWAAAVVAAFVGCSTPSDNTNEDNMRNAGGPFPAAGTTGAPAERPEMIKASPSSAYPSNYPGIQAPGKKDDEAKAEEKEAKPADESKPKDEAKPDEAKPKDEEPKKKEDGQAKAGEVKLSAEEVANIKKLPEADQAAALAQKVCLVNEEQGENHLGAMGVPVKRVVKGRTVFLCCKGCIEDLEKDPDKYLAKLDQLTGKK